MSKIVLSGHIVVPKTDLDRVREALPEHITLTLQEQGCIKFEVTQKSSSPNELDVYEEFINKEAFEYHQTRVKESEWGKITLEVKRYYSVTEVDELN
jgi:quinol monooxygenase YgiN